MTLGDDDTNPDRRPRGPAKGGGWWARQIHFWLSTFGFAAILFFGVTGLTLNHAESFESGDPATRDFEGVLDAIPEDLAAPTAHGSRFLVADALRHRHELSGLLRDVHVDDGECTVIFGAPGYAADVFIDRKTGAYKGQETRKPRIAFFDDLHKGRYAGAVWAFVIDASAVVTVASALTGLWLLFHMRGRRTAGLVAVVVGTLACVAACVFGIA